VTAKPAPLPVPPPPNPPAFPTASRRYDGMCLRDFFASHVASGYLANTVQSTMLPDPREVADYAYKVADAMLTRRVPARPPAEPPVPAESPELVG